MKNWEHFLTITAEEASEIIKEAAKCLRFGVNDTNPNEPQCGNNGEKLGWEIDDLIAMAEILRKEMIIPPSSPARIEQKKIRVMRWLEYSRGKGRVDAEEASPPLESTKVENIHLPKGWYAGAVGVPRSHYLAAICGGMMKTDEHGTAWTEYRSKATCPECLKLYDEVFPATKEILSAQESQIGHWSKAQLATAREPWAVTYGQPMAGLTPEKNPHGFKFEPAPIRKEGWIGGEMVIKKIPEKCICGHMRDNHAFNGTCGSPGCDCTSWRLYDAG